ncbi:phosphotransferase [bacterium]|nr:phosphotransferase [bacterium]
MKVANSIRRKYHRRHYDRKRLFGMTGWTWFQLDEVGWWIREEWFDRLAGPHGLKWQEWRKANRLRVVKDGPHRTVYHVDLGDTGVYVKHYRVPDFRARLRQWFRRGKARNEGSKALKLDAIGVRTFTPLALGEQRKRGFLYENYLVTEAIPDVEPLDAFLEKILPEYESGRQADIRRSIGDALARLCSRLHEAGYVHGDFHPGNILIRLMENDEPRLYLIDLDAVRQRGEGLSVREIRDNLAQLNNYFFSRSSRAERLRFLEAYLKYRGRHNPISPLEMGRFARQIEKATRTWAERLWRRWAKRGLGTNKYYKTFRDRNTWGVFSRVFEREHVREIVEDPERLMYDDGSRILKHSRSSTVAEVTVRTSEGPRRVIVKKIPTYKPRDFWFGWLRTPRCLRAWKAAGHLVARDVPTPRPLGYLVKGWPGLPGFLTRRYPAVTYTIMDRPERMVQLEDHLRFIQAEVPEANRKSVIDRSAVALAAAVRKLHAKSLSHRDMKAANILVMPRPDGSFDDVSWIDLVGVTLEHPLPYRNRVQNLARLAISIQSKNLLTNAAALRFIKSYLPLAFLPRNSWKKLWRDVLAEMRQKSDRNLRIGRPLS